MSEPFFKAEDFRIYYVRDGATPSKVFECYAQQAAEDANAKLESLGTDPVTKFFRDECERLRAELAALKAEIELAIEGLKGITT